MTRELEQILDGQHRLVRTREAVRCGVSQRDIARLVRRGEWQRMFHGIYAVHPTEDDPLVLASHAALLYAGRDAAVSHFTTLALLGVAVPTDPLHVAVGGREVRSTPGLQAHTRRAFGPGERVTIRGVVSVTVSEALARSWRMLDVQDRQVAVVCDVVTAGHASATELLEAFPRLRIRHPTRLAETCRLVAQGCHSPLEVRYYLDVERAFGLPPADERQHVIKARSGRSHRVDVVYLAPRIVIELDGKQHLDSEARHRDLLRTAELRELGFLVLRFTWDDVVRRPGWVAATVRSALAQRAA